MNISRRDFLKLVSAGTCGAAIHNMLSPLDGLMAYADPIGGNSSKKVFVLINCSGGASYNIAPVYHSHYRDRNPNVSYGPENSIILTNEQGLHPSLTSLRQVWNDGDLALMNLIGAGVYQSRSHEDATDQWFTQNTLPTKGGVTEGWAARLTSQIQSVFGGVSFGGSNLFVKGGSNPPRVISSLNSLIEPRIFNNNDDSMQLQLARSNIIAQHTNSNKEAQEHVFSSIEKLQSNVQLLRQYANMNLPVTFPTNGLGPRFRDAARLIAAGSDLGVRLIIIERGGFDTHGDEKPALAGILSDINGGLGAFIDCMKALGRWDDVVIGTMSEFTRTMENSSKGTDHGLAGPQLIIGGAVKGGIKTPAPTAEEIGSRDIIRATHGTFAQVFGEIIQEFMGLDAAKVFNGDIPASPYFDVI